MGHKLHTLCFSLWAFLFLHALLTCTCPVSVMFTAHSQSKSHCLRMLKCHYLSPLHTGVSSSAFSVLEVLLPLNFSFISNSSRNFYIIYFLLLEHSLLHVLPHSSLQPATAPHQRFKVSTSTDPSDFCTDPILFFIETTFIFSSAHLPMLQARFFTAFCWCDFCQTQKKGTKSVRETSFLNPSEVQ